METQIKIPKGKYKNLKNYITKFFDYPYTSCQDFIGNRELDTSNNTTYPSRRYLFEKKITDGSASVIYKARDTVENKDVIIKSISKREVWRKELNILKEFLNADSRILKYLDFFESDRRSYIVTEFYNGFDLFEHIDINVPYKEHIGIILLLEMAKCIKECHDRNIIHLDIKCENYMVNKEKLFEMSKPNIVLIDFGHAEKIKDSSIDKLYYGYNYGTSFYLCPEGYKNIYSSKSDIWSLGVCMSLILTGDYPFRGSENEYIRNAKHNNVKLSKTLSRESESLIKRCLNSDPLKRPNIDQVISFLEFTLSCLRHDRS